MLSGTSTPVVPRDESTQRTESERCETFIEKRLCQTRRQVKSVDLARGLMTLLIGVLAYLFAAALIDHWVIDGGLGFWGRLSLLSVLLGVGGYYAALHIVPPLWGRINPLFAADTIERGRPGLKNSLINFLMTRGRREEVPAVIYKALQNRAAADLSRVPPEAAVDHRPVIRLGYALIATMVICCLYLVLSDKNPLVSVARVLLPWAGIKAPTRVTFEDVQPGDVVAFHGEQVTVLAKVRGVDQGEEVMLVYGTADGQSVGQTIPMTATKDVYRYECKLPPGNLGLQTEIGRAGGDGDFGDQADVGPQGRALHPG